MSAASWGQEGVKAFSCRVAVSCPLCPSARVHTHTHLPNLHPELGLGTEDGKGEAEDSGDLGKPHCFQK